LYADEGDYEDKIYEDGDKEDRAASDMQKRIDEQMKKNSRLGSATG
jgi:hypothetical protein